MWFVLTLVFVASRMAGDPTVFLLPENATAEQRAEIVAKLKEGDVVDGVVKNVTDYGAFVDLGGVDGLVHVSELSWKHIDHPGEVVEVGDEVTVELEIDGDTISDVSVRGQGCSISQAAGILTASCPAENDGSCGKRSSSD